MKQLLHKQAFDRQNGMCILHTSVQIALTFLSIASATCLSEKYIVFMTIERTIGTQEVYYLIVVFGFLAKFSMNIMHNSHCSCCSAIIEQVLVSISQTCPYFDTEHKMQEFRRV
jgi:hypothetical protein